MTQEELQAIQKRWVGDLNGSYDDVRALLAEVERLTKDNEHLESTLKDIAEGDCFWGDGCPTFGSRHGECLPCKARKALEP